MSEEEVIKKINEIRKEYSTMDSLTEYVEAIDIVLNLVNEQQKEIEELKDKNKTLEGLLQGNLFELYLHYKELASKYQANSISKDKIREKIKHYNNELEHIKNGEEFENEKPMYYWGKVALEDLLEEN